MPVRPSSASISSSHPDKIVSADEAYFAPQVIACRDGSGSFPRSRLNDGYCDCTDGTDEPGFSLSALDLPELDCEVPNCVDLVDFADVITSDWNVVVRY